jgi:peptidoglycan/LPS O-acetylase OafA/YrhL
LRQIPQLDGLRAIAVLIVMIGHAIGYSQIGSLSAFGEIASLGVDLFFVLSGFLITSILIASKGSAHYYRNFFGRRALRIWPLYYAFLLSLYIFGVVVPVPDWSFHGYHFGWYIIYSQALRYPVSIGPDPLSITWSLAIEEQFYILWPFLVALGSVASVRKIAWLIVIAAPLFRVIYLHFGLTPYIAFVCRVDAIALGSLVALWLVERGENRHISKRFAFMGLASCFLAICICVATPMRQILAHSLSSALFTFVLLLALCDKTLVRALSLRALRYIGSVSYCLYLVHLPVIMILRHHIQSKIVFCAVSLALSVALAELSRRYFETPILRLKDRWFASTKKFSMQPASVVGISDGSARST